MVFDMILVVEVGAGAHIGLEVLVSGSVIGSDSIVSGLPPRAALPLIAFPANGVF